jgi:hypothetical protein
MKFLVASARKPETVPQDAAYIELPATESEIERTAREIKLGDAKTERISIVGTEFGQLSPLLEHLPLSNVNLRELNLLAYQLKDFYEGQQKDYFAVLTDRGEFPIKDLINFAYDVDEYKYKIWHGVKNYVDLGKYDVSLGINTV